MHFNVSEQFGYHAVLGRRTHPLVEIESTVVRSIPSEVVCQPHFDSTCRCEADHVVVQVDCPMPLQNGLEADDGFLQHQQHLRMG